ncbi:hypothetical protein M406DRAFT_328954 [Cryphonectria parasitica EP155]|uniref:Uncharacterized protein n=1 Tax=Cryphonectria parasitica (strain ATCC 38755 / EP155) TaxID=660469 RepID=A0A9P4Y6L5_CRYP1|nr:uncharacterized protein M406DRAFT_328954 [Cryphonectria parasitica EP155]KAF3767904.1 hypothetical protein M406DRAFT_328954 [Cryphonectria parasitica EP155]
MKRNKEVDQETREAHELIETYILKSQNEHFHKLGYQVFDFANNVGYYWDLSRNGHYLKVWNIIRSEHNFVYTVTQFVRGLDAEAQNPEIDEGSRGCARGLLHVCEKLLHRATALHLEAQEQALQAGSGMEARQDLAEEERMWADEAPPSWAFLRTYHLIQANVFEVGRPARPPLMPWDQKPVELSAGEKGSDGSSSAESGRLAGLNSTEPASTGEVSTEKEGSSHVPQSDTPRAKALAAYLLEDFPSEEDCIDIEAE